MLKITLASPSAEATTLKIEGWINHANVALLEDELVQHSTANAVLILDLGGVFSIDQAGLELLQRWASKGLTWANTRPYVHLLLKQHGLG